MTDPAPNTFFFSSRRRHTRSLCDWSSDVCSSDLPYKAPGDFDDLLNFFVREGRLQTRPRLNIFGQAPDNALVRSEERRVGNEMRSRKGPNVGIINMLNRPYTTKRSLHVMHTITRK